MKPAKYSNQKANSRFRKADCSLIGARYNLRTFCQLPISLLLVVDINKILLGDNAWYWLIPSIETQFTCPFCSVSLLDTWFTTPLGRRLTITAMVVFPNKCQYPDPNDVTSTRPSALSTLLRLRRYTLCSVLSPAGLWSK